MNQAFSGHLKKFFAGLGPGMITGAADDDPSGISTYSIAGASFGYGPLWTALVSLPMMIAVQLMCARLGLVTGRGLASVIRTRYPPIVLWVCCALLVGANIVNIGADLAGMADATELITGVPSQWFTPVYALLILGLMIWSTYPTIARIFKWFTLALLAYILAAFLARPDFRAVVESTFLPTIQWSSAYLATLVAIFGTTISPYLFFWQSAQEVEELHSHNETTRCDSDALRSAQTDVLSGMFFSNLVMYFIILTAAATLYVNGHRDISSSKEAAEALRPLAGAGAYYLFTIGLVGAGMLGVPVLAGSSAYAIAEAANWRGSLDERPRTAHGFYAVLVLAVLLGLGMDFAGFDAIKMLFWSAVINGVVAPPLIFVIVLLTRDPRVMDAHINPRWLSLLGWATVAFMTIAVLAMLSGAWGLI